MTDNMKKTATEGEEMTTEATNTVAAVTTTATTKNEAENDVGVYTHTLKKPFTYEGKTYEKMTFNFERLTGRDMVSIEAEMQAKNEFALAPEISRIFQAKMAAKATGIGDDVIKALPIKDFNKITNAARNFLIDTGY